MIVEKIIAKKKDGDFLHYIILQKEGKAVHNNLELFAEAITSSIFQDILNYEASDKPYHFAISDDWNAIYGQNIAEPSYYIQIYDYWANENATTEDGIWLNRINGLKIKTKENLMQLINAWQLINTTKPPYIMITIDDLGWIEVKILTNIENL